MTRPFRLTMPEPSERDIHEAVADALEWQLVKPAFWCAYPAGHIRLTGQQGARLVKAGLKAGMPDILIWYRGIYLVELKRRNGRLSETKIVKTKQGALREVVGQRERFQQLRETGAVVDGAICYTVDGVLDQVAAWGIPLRGRKTVAQECKLRNGDACIKTYGADMVTVTGIHDCVGWCPILHKPVDELVA